MRAGGVAGMSQLKVAFRNFANVPINSSKCGNKSETEKVYVTGKL